MGRVRTFRELRVFQGAFGAAMEIFRLSRGFPPDERYALIDQVRRSSRSVAANIAEAWRKRRYAAAFAGKLSDAEAEVAETRCYLDFARACGYPGHPPSPTSPAPPGGPTPPATHADAPQTPPRRRERGPGHSGPITGPGLP